MGRIRHPHRGQLSGPIIPRQLERIPPIGLHPFSRFHRYQRGRHDSALRSQAPLSLYAAFNTKTGEVLGKTTVRHTSAEFVAFLTDIVIDQPRGKEIHVIADNQSAHKSRLSVQSAVTISDRVVPQPAA